MYDLKLLSKGHAFDLQWFLKLDSRHPRHVPDDARLSNQNHGTKMPCIVAADLHASPLASGGQDVDGDVGMLSKEGCLFRSLRLFQGAVIAKRIATNKKGGRGRTWKEKQNKNEKIMTGARFERAPLSRVEITLHFAGKKGFLSLPP